MSYDINKVIVSGRVVYEPTKNVVPTQNGQLSILKIVIANQGFKGNEANFFDCVIWGKNADFFSDKLKKGSLVLVDGSLKQDKWIDKNTGQNRSKIVINVLNIYILDYEKTSRSENSIQDESKISPNINNDMIKEENLIKNQIDDSIITKSRDELEGESLEDQFANDIDSFDDSNFGSNNFEDENNNYYR